MSGPEATAASGGASRARRVRGALAPHGSAFATVAFVAYTHLWIAEGALRKWVPFLDRPMYIARDALAVAALLFLLLARSKYATRLTTALVVATAALTSGILLSALTNSVPAPVAVAGLRAYVAPAIAIITASMATSDASRRVMRAIAIWAPINALIATLQANSAPGAFVNRQASGEDAAFIQNGTVRATGTFTAPAGLTTYLMLAFGVALLLSLRKRGAEGRVLGLVALVATVVAVTVSGSRGSVLGVAIIAVFAIWHALASKGLLTVRNLAGLALIVGGAFVATKWLFPGTLTAFGQRFSDASASEDSSGRLVEQLVGFPSYFESLLGAGPGVHSQAGLALGSAAGWIEDDSAKYVAELGVIGLALATMRLAIVALCLVLPFVRPRRWPLSVSLVVVTLGAQQFVGQITQNPSSQGAFAISVALVMWALLEARAGTPDSPEPPAAPRTRARSQARQRRIDMAS